MNRHGRQNHHIVSVAILSVCLQHDTTGALQTPSRPHSTSSSCSRTSSSPHGNSLLVQRPRPPIRSSSMWRRQATIREYCSSTSRRLLAVPNSTTTATDDDDGATTISSTDVENSYEMSILQTFLMEEYAQDVLSDLQDLNCRTSKDILTTTGSTMVVALPAPSTVLEDSKKFSEPIASTIVNDGTVEQERDEGDVWRARLLLVGAAALYGTNFSLVKLLGDSMPVGISSTLRFGLAALATLPWLVDSKLLSSDNKNARAAAWLGLEVGMWNSIGYVAQAVGLETTLASKSAFICSMAVVVVPLLEFMTGKKLLARQWVGALLALVGVAFLELGGGDGIGDAIASLTTGDALSMIQPLMFGIGFWKMEKAMHKFPTEARRLTAGQLMAVFLGSAVYGLYSMDAAAHASESSATWITFANTCPWRDWLTDPSILFSLFWTGCVTTALTIYMETVALETLSASETTLIFSTEPLWGTAFAAAVMGEHLGMNAVVGAFFIVTACVYSNLGVQGLEHSRRAGTTWLKQKLTRSNVTAQATSNDSAPVLSSFQERWSWIPSSLASSLATWNVATSNLNAQELNDIVDDLVDKLS